MIVIKAEGIESLVGSTASAAADEASRLRASSEEAERCHPILGEPFAHSWKLKRKMMCPEEIRFFRRPSFQLGNCLPTARLSSTHAARQEPKRVLL